VGLPLVAHCSDPQGLLDRLVDLDVVAVLDSPGIEWMSRLAKATGRRLVYRPGQYDSAPSAAAEDAYRLTHLLQQLHAIGCRRAGIYGAGRKAASLVDDLADSPVEVAAVFDDDARRHGDRLARWPIRPLSDVHRVGVEAIVVCSDRFEAPMLRRCRKYQREGIIVTGLRRQANIALDWATSGEEASGRLSGTTCAPQGRSLPVPDATG
jgi:hypothetical protein